MMMLQPDKKWNVLRIMPKHNRELTLCIAQVRHDVHIFQEQAKRKTSNQVTYWRTPGITA